MTKVYSVARALHTVRCCEGTHTLIFYGRPAHGAMCARLPRRRQVASRFRRALTLLLFRPPNLPCACAAQVVPRSLPCCTAKLCACAADRTRAARSAVTAALCNAMYSPTLLRVSMSHEPFLHGTRATVEVVLGDVKEHPSILDSRQHLQSPGQRSVQHSNHRSCCSCRQCHRVKAGWAVSGVTGMPRPGAPGCRRRSAAARPTCRPAA